MSKHLLLLTALLFSIACNSYNDKDMSAMNPFKNLKTECVGRVLIDLPHGTGTWTQSFDNGDAARLDTASLDDFRRLISERKIGLRNKKHEKAGSMLVAESEPTETTAAIIFHTDPDVVSGPDLERYIWTGQTGYKVHTQALKEGTLAYAQKYFGVFGKLRARSDSPTEPGFCIDGALVTGSAFGEFGTRADYGVRPTKWPGVSVGLLVEENQDRLGNSAFESLKTEESSAKERQGPEAGLKHFTVLRKQERQLDGYAGQETISLTELKNGTKLYSFRWRTLGQLKSIVRPHITVTMDTDNPLQGGTYISAPPEEEMLGLWDAVLTSLHPRPGALPAGAK